MDANAWFVLGVLFLSLALFISDRVRSDLVAAGVLIALAASRVLTPAEALAGFSNPAVITIAALFVLGGGMLHTGLAAAAGRWILEVAGQGETRLIVVLMLAGAVLSAFLSNTGTVALLLPAVLVLCRNTGLSPSRLLIPLAFGSSLGGVLTLIGTPTNLIVSGALRDAGLQPFGFFTLAPIGVILLVSGTLYMLLVGRRLLPRRMASNPAPPAETPEELMDRYRLPDGLFRLRIRQSSPLAGRNLADSRLGQDFGVTVLEVQRPLGLPDPDSIKDTRHFDVELLVKERTEVAARAETELQAQDVLLVQGADSNVRGAAERWLLGLQEAGSQATDALVDEESGVCEVLVPHRSALVGRTVVEAGFASRYGLYVVGGTRPGRSESFDVKQTPLRFGDVLLVQGYWERILALRDERRDLILLSDPEALAASPQQKRAPLALAILAGMVVAMLTQALPVSIAALAAALLIVLGGCLTPVQLYRSIDFRSVVLVAGMLPLSTALVKVHLVEAVSRLLTENVGGLGPLAVLACLFLMTAVFSQVMSNTATAVLLAPIAVTAAASLGVDARPFLMAVAVAASMAFASPVASPVNTLVMGSGEYSFGDYAKVGIPLILLSFLIVVLVLPLLSPF